MIVEVIGRKFRSQASAVIVGVFAVMGYRDFWELMLIPDMKMQTGHPRSEEQEAQDQHC
jgi:hypothetical protein